MTKDKIKYQLSCAKGASLVELAIVLTIIGVMVGFSILITPQLVTNSQIEMTDKKMEKVVSALSAYAQRHSRLPCPADVRSTSGYDKGTERNDGHCFINDSPEDVFENAQGVVPWKELGLMETDVLDAWGNYFTYRPAPHLTVNTYDEDMQSDPTGADIHNACRSQKWYTTTGDDTGLHTNRQKALFCCSSHPKNDYLTAKGENNTSGNDPSWKENSIAVAGAFDEGKDPNSDVNVNLSDSNAWTDEYRKTDDSNKLFVAGSFDETNSANADSPLSRAASVAVTLISHGKNGNFAYVRDQDRTSRKAASIDGSTIDTPFTDNYEELRNAAEPNKFFATAASPKSNSLKDNIINMLSGNDGASDDIVFHIRNDQLIAFSGEASCNVAAAAGLAPCVGEDCTGVPPICEDEDECQSCLREDGSERYTPGDADWMRYDCCAQLDPDGTEYPGVCGATTCFDSQPGETYWETNNCCAVPEAAANYPDVCGEVESCSDLTPSDQPQWNDLGCCSLQSEGDPYYAVCTPVNTCDSLTPADEPDWSTNNCCALHADPADTYYAECNQVNQCDSLEPYTQAWIDGGCCTSHGDPDDPEYGASCGSSCTPGDPIGNVMFILDSSASMQAALDGEDRLDFFAKCNISDQTDYEEFEDCFNAPRYHGNGTYSHIPIDPDFTYPNNVYALHCFETELICEEAWTAPQVFRSIDNSCDANPGQARCWTTKVPYTGTTPGVTELCYASDGLLTDCFIERVDQNGKGIEYRGCRNRFGDVVDCSLYALSGYADEYEFCHETNVCTQRIKEDYTNSHGTRYDITDDALTDDPTDTQVSFMNTKPMTRREAGIRIMEAVLDFYIDHEISKDSDPDLIGFTILNKDLVRGFHPEDYPLIAAGDVPSDHCNYDADTPSNSKLRVVCDEMPDNSTLFFNWTDRDDISDAKAMAKAKLDALTIHDFSPTTPLFDTMLQVAERLGNGTPGEQTAMYIISDGYENYDTFGRLKNDTEGPLNGPYLHEVEDIRVPYDPEWCPTAADLDNYADVQNLCLTDSTYAQNPWCSDSTYNFCRRIDEERYFAGNPYGNPVLGDGDEEFRYFDHEDTIDHIMGARSRGAKEAILGVFAHRYPQYVDDAVWTEPGMAAIMSDKKLGRDAMLGYLINRRYPNMKVHFIDFGSHNSLKEIVDKTGGGFYTQTTLEEAIESFEDAIDKCEDIDPDGTLDPASKPGGGGGDDPGPAPSDPDEPGVV